jgi:adenylate kinase
MNIALLGPTGAGKGTQSTALAGALDLQHFSTGDLFREHVTRQTALGLLARKYMDAGELVPDEVVEAMIEEQIRKSEPGRDLLFDGFPRTEGQAHFLDELFASLNRRLDAAILLDLPEEFIIQRLTGRLVCQQCHQPYNPSLRPPARAGRCDLCDGELAPIAQDHPEMVHSRLQAFRRSCAPVLDYYRRSGRLHVIDARGTVDEVQFAIDESLKRPQPSELIPHAPVELLLETQEPALLPPARAVTGQLNLVLLGGPGSGKGTQAESLSREFKLPHIATGDLFRENLKNDTDLGRLAKGYMNRGELVPDEVTEAMVRERLARPDTAPGFVLDGFPRTLPQAMALADILHRFRRHLTGVIYIAVSDEAIVQRLSGRWICRNCQAPYHLQFKPPAKAGVCDLCGGPLIQRDDDNATTVRSRLKTFHAQTEPLIEHYTKAGLLHKVQGENAVKEVTTQAVSIIRQLTQPAIAL